MNKRGLKKLAVLTLKKDNIDEKIASFVLAKLSRKELKLYFRFLKDSISRQTVFVKSRISLNTNTRNQIKKMFSEKNVKFLADESVEEGIKVIDNDTIIDLSLGNYIKEAVSNIKNVL